MFRKNFRKKRNDEKQTSSQNLLTSAEGPFDKWVCYGEKAWIEYELQDPIKLRAYGIKSPDNNNQNMPYAWEILVQPPNS